MLIRVTKEHIRKGRKHICSACPIALALKGSGFPNAFVGSGYWAVSKKAAQNKEDSPLPTIAVNFIDKFDSGEEVKPFTFRIRKPKNRGK